MTNQRDPKIVNFLKEYKKLAEKHGYIISGCGCCSSPILEDIKDDKALIIKNVNHLLYVGYKCLNCGISLGDLMGEKLLNKCPKCGSKCLPLKETFTLSQKGDI